MSWASYDRTRRAPTYEVVRGPSREGVHRYKPAATRPNRWSLTHPRMRNGDSRGITGPASTSTAAWKLRDSICVGRREFLHPTEAIDIKVVLPGTRGHSRQFRRRCWSGRRVVQAALQTGYPTITGSQLSRRSSTPVDGAETAHRRPLDRLKPARQPWSRKDRDVRPRQERHRPDGRPRLACAR